MPYSYAFQTPTARKRGPFSELMHQTKGRPKAKEVRRLAQQYGLPEDDIVVLLADK